MRIVAKLTLFCLLAVPALAVPAQTTLFTATLKNGTGSVITTAYLHFELWNCGTNFPTINGQPATIAQFTFDLHPNATTGLISGFIYGNDDILCGNIPSTQWIITPMFGQNQPFGPSHKYVICDSVIPAGESFCSNTVFGTAAFASLLPTDGYPPPSPGFNVVYSNPVASQTQTQPALTEMKYVGTYDFCSATVLCGGGGSTSPGSPSGSLQYNNSGSFAGTSVLATNGSTAISGNTNSITWGSSGLSLIALGGGVGTGALVLSNLAGSGAVQLGDENGNELMLGTSLYNINLTNIHLDSGLVNTSGNTTYLYGSPLQLGVNPFLGSVNNVSNGLTISSSASTLVGPWNVPSGVTLTIQSGASLVCAAGSTCPSSGTGGGNPQLENGTPDETGNSFYTVASLTNYFSAHWELVFNTTTYVNYTVFCPSARTGDTIAVDVWSADSTAGHTASITYADGVINSGTMNIGSLTSASPQTFTTTSTANNRVTLTFTVQSTISAGSILVVKIGTTPTGTAPTANIQIYPHFV